MYLKITFVIDWLVPEKIFAIANSSLNYRS